MLHEMTCEHSWFKQMCKDKSGRDETTNFLTLLSRMVWKLFHTFPRHWRHQFWSLLVQREDKQSGTERRGVWTLYDNDTRDRVHIVVHLLSVLFMIRMLMSFPLWYHGALSGCTDSAAATRTNHWTVSAVFLFFFSCQQFIFCGRIILASAMWGWQGSKEVGKGRGRGCWEKHYHYESIKRERICKIYI